jgi:DNA polymerase-1
MIHYAKQGGHSVKNWGRQFGLVKKFIEDWDDESKLDEYVERCIYDVDIQEKIFETLKKYVKEKAWSKAIRAEHNLAIYCQEMHENGFYFDKKLAEETYHEICARMQSLEEEIRETVPVSLVQDDPVLLRRKKDGTPTKRTVDNIGDCDNFVDGVEYWRFHYAPFEPSSTKQRIELLNKAGWKPTEKTSGHIRTERELSGLSRSLRRAPTWKVRSKRKEQDELKKKMERFRVYGWKVNETNLNTLPKDAPAGAHLLAEWLSLEGRRSDLEEWLGHYNPLTHRIHGQFNGIGSWTHRMSHVKPNQGNIFSTFYPEQCQDKDNPTRVESVKLRYNGLLRSFWGVEPGNFQIGTDAEGIQTRVFAHYVNNPEYTKTIEEGDKKLRTDVHSYNANILGPPCPSRDHAKTFFYAWLLGCGVGKAREILGCTLEEARQAVGDFVQRIPGIAELKQHHIPADWQRGYFVGFDGRKVIPKSERHMLAGYLQNGEKVVMTHALHRWKQQVDALGIGYRLVDFVHDEWQTEAYNEEEAHEIGRLQADSIRWAGEELGVKCKLAGEYKIGKNWLETH